MTKESSSTKRGAAYLQRLAETKGAPIRVDMAGPDLQLLDALVQAGYAPSRAEAFRRAVREVHLRLNLPQSG